MLLRSMRFALLLVCCTITAASLGAGSQPIAVASPTDVGRPDHVALTPDATTEGVGLNSIANGYLSPVVEADNPFTHMMLRWEASGLEHSHDHSHDDADQPLLLEIRTSSDGKAWNEWEAVVEDADLWMPEDGPDIHWSQIIYAGAGVRFWQVRATIQPDEDGDLPELHHIDVNTVDGRFGPDKKPVPDASLAEVGKPLVVSRTAWGNPDGQGSRVSPAYYPVSHMVVHHSADPNSFRGGEDSWDDRVRAIWAFHTYPEPSGRGWGDVGYNFLVDPNGVIYEGRSGGDNAVGFHDTGNYGSMGVVLIGTFESVNPTPSAQESLVSLLAWKAQQRGIDPLGRSYYYGCDISSYCGNAGAITPNIAGHRDVTARTSCPGDMTANLLPSLRNRVQERIDGGGGGAVPLPDNGDLLIDELEDTFARSDALWYSAACGYDGHTFYTYATDSQEESTNSATWRPKIAETGRYRVLVSIPQGCGLSANPPYASNQSRYQITSADGKRITDPIDQNTDDAWIDLGTYTFNAGTDGAVELYDLTGEPYSERKVVFFDTIKWERVEDEVDIQLVNVAYDKDTVAAGELLKVTFTVRNNGNVAVQSQAPEAGKLPGGDFDVVDGYAYDESECFLGAEGQDYPAYPKESDHFRLTLGPTNREITCSGDSGGYPWRWGINGDLQPGETRDIIGYIRFQQPGTVTLRAGLIQEYIRYHAQNVAEKTIQVVPERAAPVLASYDEQLRPLAYVYHLGDVPENLLARTRNPLSLLRGDYIGSFHWNGSQIEWGDGGPLGTTDRFLIEQARIFVAPVAGEYTFRIATDDGSWLWVDGQEVVVNQGLPDNRDNLDHTGAGDTRTATGKINLSAGPHVLAFKYFEFTNKATASYAVQMPGQNDFATLTDGFSSARRLGTTFLTNPELLLAVDDVGGSGIDRFSYSLNGGSTVEAEAPDGLLNLGRIAEGSYTLSYRAKDRSGNETDEATLTFSVNPNLSVESLFLPVVVR